VAYDKFAAAGRTCPPFDQGVPRVHSS
jgi:hypothetical protein